MFYSYQQLDTEAHEIMKKKMKKKFRKQGLNNNDVSKYLARTILQGLIQDHFQYGVTFRGKYVSSLQIFP